MRFRLQRRLPFGDCLLLVGSLEALGQWDPRAAPECRWTADHFWTVPVPLPPFRAPSRFEFKFCVRTADGAFHWEPGANHVAVLPLHPHPTSTLDLHWARPADHFVPSRPSNGQIHPPPCPPAGAASPPPTPARNPARRLPVSDPLSIAAARVVAAGAQNGLHPHPNHFEPLTFRLHCQATDAESLYVVGSIPELGLWNKMHSPLMTQLSANQFELTIHIQHHRLANRFEYKYFTRRSHDNARRWESGPNRVAIPARNGPDRVWHDRWETIRLDFRIYYPAKDTQVMHITGDLPQIGAWFKPGPTPMHLGPVETLETDVKGRKWRLSVWVKPQVQPFSYRYILVDTASKHELWEREPNRRALFDPLQPPVNSERIFRDVNFVSQLTFDQVPPDMFIGPYPQSVNDIDQMARAGVSAVFNLQTDEDFEHRAIQWSLLLERYRHHDIKVVRFQIRDFDRDSLRERLNGATHALDALLEEGRKVYIHCTAGMGRAPACAVAYLCWVKGMLLEDAVAHVKKHRKVAVPNVPVLREVLKHPY